MIEKQHTLTPTGQPRRRAWLHRALCAAAALLLLAACSHDDVADALPTDTNGEESYILLTLSLNDVSDSRATRAEGDDSNNDEREDEPQRPGVGLENTIHTVSLFIENEDGTRAHYYFDNMNYSFGNNVTQTIRLPFTDEVDEDSKEGSQSQNFQGTKNIYLGFNLSKAQIAAFIDKDEYNVSEDGYTAYDGENTYDYGLVKAYAPENGIGLARELEADDDRTDIAMFCMAGTSVTWEKMSGEGERIYRIPGTFQMRRNVAKVLTTCEVVNTGGSYVNSSTSDVTNRIVDGERGVAYCKLGGGLVYPDVVDFTYDKSHEALPDDKRDPDRNLQNSNRGWIRQSDVKFMLNGLNLKSYIRQNREWNNDQQRYDYIDPNYDDLADYVTLGEEGSVVTPNATLYQENFLYTPNANMPDSYGYYAQTLPYNESRMPQQFSSNSGSNVYYQGLYCPENTFTFTGLDETTVNRLNGYEYPWPMVTHVSITALFTPREVYIERELRDYLMGEEVTAEALCVSQEEFEPLMEQIKELMADGNDRVVSPRDNTMPLQRVLCPSEAISKALLTASLRKNNMIQQHAIDEYYEPNTPGFPPNTYFVISRQDGELLFYTYGAAAYVAETQEGWTGKPEKQLGSFVAMPRGRGYYHTYIDNRPDAKKNGPLTLQDAQVERNVSYILTISSISKPGIPDDQYIQVHTKAVDWKPAGEGTVELE